MPPRGISERRTGDRGVYRPKGSAYRVALCAGAGSAGERAETVNGMEIVYHIGMHCTEGERVMRTLAVNAERLDAAGILAPLPRVFRPVLKDAMVARRGRPSNAAEQEAMRAAIAGDSTPRRLVFSNDNFLCPALRAVEHRRLYPLADERIPWIANLFPDHPTTIALAMRNPVTLLPALHARIDGEESLDTYLARLDLPALSWEDTVARILAAAPAATLTVWCHEDAPLIWPEILAEVTGYAKPLKLDGVHEMAGSLMTEGGLARMLAYMDSHPPKNAEHTRRVTGAFLDKFARPEAVEVDLDGGPWTEDLAVRMTARYEADIAAIRQMERVRFLAP